MTEHRFWPSHTADSIADYWIAGCTCGWHGGYTHASERFAREDFEHHVEMSDD